MSERERFDDQVAAVDPGHQEIAGSEEHATGPSQALQRRIAQRAALRRSEQPEFQTTLDTLRAQDNVAGWLAAIPDGKHEQVRTQLLADRALRSWLLGSGTLLPDGAAYHSLLKLLHDGTGFSLACLRSAIDLLFGPGRIREQPLVDNAGTVQVGSGTVLPLERVFEPVSPGVEELQAALRQYQHVPRANIMSANIVFAKTYMLRVTTRHGVKYLGPQNTLVNKKHHFPVVTSSYIQGANMIVMKIASDGANLKADSNIASVNRTQAEDGSGQRPMSTFENHATHEVGHAVAARPVHKAPFDGATPNQWTARTWRWAGGSPEGYAASLGWTSDLDAKTFNLGNQDHVSGATIHRSLVALIDDKPFDTTALGDEQEFLEAAVSDPVLGRVSLIQRLDALGHSKADAYQMRFPLSPDVSRVHYPGQVADEAGSWQSVDAAAFRNKPSEYAGKSKFEYFAELYTAYFNGQTIPSAALPAMEALKTATPSELGAPQSGPAATPVADAAEDSQSVELNLNPEQQLA